MREVLGALRPWYEAGLTTALATVVATHHSAPRQPGAAMAVSSGGEVVGSVSGGCVEAAVYEAAQEVMATGVPQSHTYGVSDDDAFAVGLTCGGTLEVFVEPISRATFPQLPALLDRLAADEPVAVATVVGGPGGPPAGTRMVVLPDGVPDGHTGSLGDAGLDGAVAEDARGMLQQGTTGLRRYGPRGERVGGAITVFTQSFAPPPRLLVFGATDFTAALARQGALLGYRVTVCDARPVFTTAARFPGADEVVVEWPHRYLVAEAAAGRVDARTAVAVLTHDAKFDVPVLAVALRLPRIGYIGAMGSRRTHEDRLRRLGEAGLTRDELARLCSPVGLDIGARTPQETAVSIAAEIISHRWGGTGSRLAATTGPIHALSG